MRQDQCGFCTVSNLWKKVIADIAHLDFKRACNRVFEIKMFLSHPPSHPQICATMDVKEWWLCERNGWWEGGEILVSGWFSWSRDALGLCSLAFYS